MVTPRPSERSRGWQLFDAIIGQAPLRDRSPWVADGSRFEPDYDTLRRLLGVPLVLGATSQSGVPALALDVWVAYELRRAGFDPDRVWPRASAPRVLAPEVLQFLDTLPPPEQARLREHIAAGGGGAASANLLGKHYVKQVDVVMSSWATGPELMISTKRMDSSFGKNAANRVEESYGDAKNLRLRHPLSALGFVYGLGATALVREPDTAAWLVDLLAKLGREDDAYDAVALIIPEVEAADRDEDRSTDADPDAESEPPRVAAPDDSAGVDEAVAEEPSGPLEPGPVMLPGDWDIPMGTPAAALSDDLAESLERLPSVRLRRDAVPDELDPGRFFTVMCDRVLTATPINHHREARRRRGRGTFGRSPDTA